MGEMVVKVYPASGNNALTQLSKKLDIPIAKMGFLYSIEVVRMHHFIKYGMPPNHRPQINGMYNGYL